MIERKVLEDKFNLHLISEFIIKEIPDVPIKEIVFEKTPMGERITIHTSTPGLVIGREGSNIKKLTRALKNKFKYENPQIKINEVKEPNLSAKIMAKIMANNLSRFGSQKFKLTGFKALQNIMYAGAMGVEIRITGKLPSARAKSWRFTKGYIKKTGYVSDFLVDKAIESVTLKTGVVGIQVSIMLPGTALPDKVEYIETATIEEIEKNIVKEKVEVKSETELKEITSDKSEKKIEEVKK